MAFADKGFGEDFTAITVCDVLPGYMVKAMSVVDTASTSDPFTTVAVDKSDGAGDSILTVGIAMGSITSGHLVDVKSQCVAVMNAGAAIAAGAPVTCNDADPLAVTTATFTCAGSTNALVYTRQLGIALTVAASGEEVLVNFKI